MTQSGKQRSNVRVRVRASLLMCSYLWSLPAISQVLYVVAMGLNSKPETLNPKPSFQVLFVVANGPLAWAILAFSQSLVLHSASAFTRALHVFAGWW